MKYLDGKFTVAVGGEDYATGWERTFGKRPLVTTGRAGQTPQRPHTWSGDGTASVDLGVCTACGQTYLSAKEFTSFCSGAKARGSDNAAK